ANDGRGTRRYSTWCPAAIAAIGRLPSTLEDRSIHIQMRRRRADEAIQHLHADPDPLHAVLAQKCARWAKDTKALRSADPRIPSGLINRAADNWRPLLAVADLVGGDWPRRARGAAVSLSGVEVGNDQSDGVQLLGDVRDLYRANATGTLF